MGLFKKSVPEVQKSLRPAHVERLRRLGDAESDAVIFDVEGCPDYPQAKALLDAAVRNATYDELNAVWPGAYPDR